MRGRLVALFAAAACAAAVAAAATAAKAARSSALRKLQQGEQRILYRDTEFVNEAVPNTALSALVSEYAQRFGDVPITHATPGVKYVVVVWVEAGWGNKLPALITGFVLALFSNRRLVLHGMDPTPYLQFRFPVHTKARAWHKGMQELRLFDYDPGVISQPHLLLSTNFSAPEVADVPVWFYRDIDYKLPLLQMNPSTAAWLRHYVPDWEVFAALHPLLFRPLPHVQEQIRSFAARNFVDHYPVGIQMRTRKIKVEPSIFFSAARAAGTAGAKGRRPIYFILSDNSELYRIAATFLGADSVCWTDNKVASASQAGAWSNPGTYESGLIDMYLLSRCAVGVISHSSSFGYTGTALAGRPPVYVYGGEQGFWAALSSEPCYFDVAKLLRSGRQDDIALFKRHPHWLHHVQCHPPT